MARLLSVLIVKKNKERGFFFALSIWIGYYMQFSGSFSQSELEFTSKSTPKYLFDSPTQSVTFLLRILL